MAERLPYEYEGDAAYRETGRDVWGEGNLREPRTGGERLAAGVARGVRLRDDMNGTRYLGDPRGHIGPGRPYFDSHVTHMSDLVEDHARAHAPRVYTPGQHVVAPRGHGRADAYHRDDILMYPERNIHVLDGRVDNPIARVMDIVRPLDYDVIGLNWGAEPKKSGGGGPAKKTEEQAKKTEEKKTEEKKTEEPKARVRPPLDVERPLETPNVIDMSSGAPAYSTRPPMAESEYQDRRVMGVPYTAEQQRRADAAGYAAAKTYTANNHGYKEHARELGLKGDNSPADIDAYLSELGYGKDWSYGGKTSVNAKGEMTLSPTTPNVSPKAKALGLAAVDERRREDIDADKRRRNLEDVEAYARRHYTPEIRRRFRDAYETALGRGAPQAAALAYARQVAEGTGE